MPKGYVAPIKSVGHGTTCICDLDSDYEVWRVLYELAQDVQHRLRKYELAARGIQITVKDKDLDYRQYQVRFLFRRKAALRLPAQDMIYSGKDICGISRFVR